MSMKTLAHCLVTAQSQHYVQNTTLLDVVVCKGASVLKLLPCEDETLLVGWDALLVLDLRLHIPDSVI